MWGRRLLRSVSKTDRPVHPHVRGEDAKLGLGKVSHHGSPPRAWGRRAPEHGGPSWRRFTPTCVGKTSRHITRHRRRPVHPHVRGEDGRGSVRQVGCCRFTPTCVGKTSWQAYDLPSLPGSPPRAWGRRRWSALAISGHQRFTPTCVGKTTRRFGVRAGLSGSPPRAWGRRQHGSHSTVRAIRFTPTCVGKTPAKLAAGATLTGSPPRAWGRRAPSKRRIWRPSRFTPTCVGKTEHGRP